ncbi:MAG: Asp-tRNA(Asn)/Glu-tRNA(Gln) amidotransferase subunit GatC [Sediminibacterium sp.]
MEITREMVESLAHLARLRFSETEKEAIRSDLQKMVACVEKLEEVDTQGVSPLLHMGDAANVLRDDVVKGSVTRAEALLNAPGKDEVFFKVPKVIKK